MAKAISRIFFLFVFSALLSIHGTTSLDRENQIDFSQAQQNNQESSKSLNIYSDFGKIPLYFIANKGQVNEGALFYAKTSRYTLWLTNEGLVFDSTRKINKESKDDITYERDVSRLVFIDANQNVEIIPVNQNEHKVNYLIGNDQSKWRTNIPTSSSVLYRELYPHIDLKVYGIEKQIEYDFVVKPGAQVSDIRFEYKDVEKTKIDKEGNLVVETKFGELEHGKPVCYQVIDGEKIEIRAKFKKIENSNYGFKVEEYNKNYELIIDPLVLIYSTYLGGSDDDTGVGIAVDQEGAVYMTGITSSVDFPTQIPYQENHVLDDAFITKVNAAGNALIYSTYLGGSDKDVGKGIAVDTEGAAYVTGETSSVDFTTQNPIQSSYGGGTSDAFITKVNAAGNALIYSTYLGGSDGDFGNGIAVDSEGVTYVTGNTYADDFPTHNPIQGSHEGGGDVFITKINASGTSLVYSTYLGGSGEDGGKGIAVDSEGAAYVTGSARSDDFPTQNPTQGTYVGAGDTFITKVNSSGSALVYSTYLGGSSQDLGHGIAVDSEGAAYVTGLTMSSDFPTQNPIQDSFGGSSWWDAFITKLSASGTSLVYSTYLGGSYQDSGNGIAVDSEGAVYVTGYSYSTNFPTQNPIQDSFGGGWGDAFITKLNASGTSLVNSTYLGGSDEDCGNGIAVDSEGDVYVIGATTSVAFPTQNPIQGSNAGSHDAFVVKLNFTYSLTISASSGGTTNPSPGSHEYNEGTEVTITATPNSGYIFVGWGGDVTSTANPITITMDSNKSIKANFTQESGGDGGDIGGDGGDGKGLCFIATACYGTPMAEEVKILSSFRDQYLLPNPIGRALVKVYYKHSPKVAHFIRDKENLKAIVREFLKPVIKIISRIVQ